MDSDARHQYQHGRDLMEQGRLEPAVQAFAQSVQSAPHFKTLELMGECLIGLGRWSEAIVPLAAATTLNQGVRAPSLLADVFARLHQWNDAERMAELALRRDPNNKKAREVQQVVASRSQSRELEQGDSSS